MILNPGFYEIPPLEAHSERAARAASWASILKSRWDWCCSAARARP